MDIFHIGTRKSIWGLPNAVGTLETSKILTGINNFSYRMTPLEFGNDELGKLDY